MFLISTTLHHAIRGRCGNEYRKRVEKRWDFLYLDRMHLRVSCFDVEVHGHVYGEEWINQSSCEQLRLFYPEGIPNHNEHAVSSGLNMSVNQSVNLSACSSVCLSTHVKRWQWRESRYFAVVNTVEFISSLIAWAMCARTCVSAWSDRIRATDLDPDTKWILSDPMELWPYTQWTLTAQLFELLAQIRQTCPDTSLATTDCMNKLNVSLHRDRLVLTLVSRNDGIFFTQKKINRPQIRVSEWF